MHHMHYRGGWGFGGPFMMRRIGYPLFPFGGFGMGLGMGSGSLLGDLLAGGLGYLMGKRSAQQQQPMPQYQQYQPPQYQQAAPQYQQYQAPYSQAQNDRLAQLRLLGQLRSEGVLTEDEFQAEKQRILNGY